MESYKMESLKDLDINTDVFKMNEITKKTNLTPRTIRYYESEGLLGDVQRSIGYTRYFTNADIVRLREIIRLKKKGYKIAQIKDIFLKKYPPKTVVLDHQLSIRDVFLQAEDIATCVKNNVHVMESSIELDAVTVNYMDWSTLNDKSYLKPFKIQPKKDPKSKGVQLDISPTKAWTGNGMRAIVRYLLNAMTKRQITPELIEASKANLTEWLIMPVSLDQDYRFLNTLPQVYIIEQRSATISTQNIVFEPDILAFLEKQLKMVSTSVNGLLNQVTFHGNSKATHTPLFSNFIKKMVPHRGLLSIEELSPFYIESTGSSNVILISMV
ncbi:MAG: MerR family transcriptional regulator [Candidatus Marinamargulisbacteria bacterium]